MALPAVHVQNVSKSFRLYRERHSSLKAAVLHGRRARYDVFWALRDVTLDVPKGATLGLVGANGSGKSTLLKCIARILLPNAGRITTSGTVASLLELGSGFHPELSGRENVYLNASMLGISRASIDERLSEIIDFADIGGFIDQPVKNYSSGMYVRLGFSVAVNLDPDILLVDEVLAVGDANFQDKCVAKFDEFRRAGKTVILASHALGAVNEMCDEVASLKSGRLTGFGASTEVLDEYLIGHRADRPPPPSKPAGPSAYAIEEVHVLDPQGRMRDAVPTGDRIDIRVRYRTTGRIAEPSFVVALDSLTRGCAWEERHRTAPIDRDGTITVTVPRLALRGGTYTVRVSVEDDADPTRPAAAGPLDLRLQVTEDAGPESHGVAALDGQWSPPEPLTTDRASRSTT